MEINLRGVACKVASYFQFMFCKFHLLEVNEVSEVKEVNDVCFVQQRAIYIPHGGIVDNIVTSVNSERSDNSVKFSLQFFRCLTSRYQSPAICPFL